MFHPRKSAAQSLPVPTGEALDHHQKLVDLIQNEIVAAGGQITFARFMQLALYAPALGYYIAGQQKFGRDGDFITAPELSPLFSRCLARQCQQILAATPHGRILEFGAGSGIMAATLLAELEQLNALPDHYEILELSPELQQRQRATIEQKVPHLTARVTWLSQLPEPGWRGVMLANEVLDAMPVHAVSFDSNGIWERYISVGENGFQWQHGPLSSAALTAETHRLRAQFGNAWPSPYETEIGLIGQAWVGSLAAVLEQGAILAIDYGFPEHEYYHPDRAQGTVMCHYRHLAHTDPLILAGLQDITAHVDFTLIANAAVECGLSVSGFTTQAYFLLGCGLELLLANSHLDGERAYFSATTQAKILTMPSEMGELFKVIALTKNLTTDLCASLTGFAAYDQRRRL
jgi:SAM-dependent MidA family methyltransferase